MLVNHFSPPLEQLGNTFLLCRDGHSNPRAATSPIHPVTRWGWTPGLRRRETLRKKKKHRTEMKELAPELSRSRLSNPVAAGSPQHFSPVAGDSAGFPRPSVTDHWAQTWETFSSHIAGNSPWPSYLCKPSHLPVLRLLPPWSWDSQSVKWNVNENEHF